MESIDPREWLSAADCASRTGLTPRALRVYEELGLIAPRRSAAGWRQYGPQDLTKLNTIALLKTAGLSLAQIGEVTCSGAGEPSLRRILAIQLDTWKRRRTDAERGQAIAEAALNRLRADQSLSVDELCRLIRNPEMTQSQSGTVSTCRMTDRAGQLCRFYRRGEYGVTTIWRDGQSCSLTRRSVAWVPSRFTRRAKQSFIQRTEPATFNIGFCAIRKAWSAASWRVCKGSK